MKRVLNLDETPPALEGCFNAAIKLGRELPTGIDGKYTSGGTIVFS